MIRTFVRCMRLDLLPMGIAGVIGGTACAAYMGNLDILSALIALLFVCVVQLTSNLLHRFIDESRNYGENLTEGIRAVGPVPLKQLLREAAFGMGIVSIMLGFTILSMTGWWFAALGVTLAALMYFYAAAPRPISRSGLNPILFFFVFGPLCVGATSLMQTTNVEARELWVSDMMPTIWVSISIGLYAVNMLIADQFDSACTMGKDWRHKSVRSILGVKSTRVLYIGNSILAAAMIVPFTAGQSLPDKIAVMAVPVVCMLSSIFFGTQIHANPDESEASMLKRTSAVMIIFALGLLVSGIILGHHVGASHARAYFT